MTTVMIGGTSANDTIRLDAVSGAVFVTVNGHTTQYTDANVERFEFRTLGGDDTIDLERTSDNTIFIDAGGDDDLVRLAPVNRNLGIIDADITCRGGTGTDRIEFDDSAVPAGGASTSYDLANNVFTRTPFANPVTFTEFEESKIACGGRDDFISVSNDDVETEITGGAGNDQLSLGTVSGDLSLDNDALVTFDGQAGIDEVRLNDWAGNWPHTYGIDTEPLLPGDTIFGRLGFGGLGSYNNEIFLLECSSADNRIELNQVLGGPGVSVSIKGNGGDDTLVVAGRTGRLADVPAVINFDGGSSATEFNKIELVDEGNSDPTTYTFTASRVAFPGFGQINYWPDEVNEVELQAGNNLSTINVRATDVELTLDGNGGADVFNIGNLTPRLDDVNEVVNVIGGVATDELYLFDQNSATANASVSVQTDSISVGPSFLATYREVEGLTYHAGNLGSAAQSLGTPAALTVNGGSGTDTITVGGQSTGDLARFPRAVTFNGGGGGADRATLFDEGSTASDDYVITEAQVTHPAFGGFSYDAIEELYVYASQGRNSIAIDSTRGGTATYVYGRGDNDGFHIARAGRDLTAIRGFLRVAGEAGQDGIALYDTASTAAEQTTITASSVVHPAFGPFDYLTAESLVLEAGSGNDVIAITSTAAGAPVTARGNDGNDHFRVGGSSVAGLNDLPARVSLEGGDDVNSAELLDLFGFDNDSFTVTATTVSQTGFGGLSYSDLATLNVDANAGNNSFTVNSTPNATDVRLRGHGGNDFLEVNATSLTRPVIIDAGSGTANVINSLPGTSARLTIENHQTLQSLTLIGDARASIAGAGTCVLTDFLTVLGGARLDVGRGGVAVNYNGTASPLQTLRGQINAGYNAGLWNGAGIVSSAAASNAALAVGYAEASDVLGASGGTFMGRAVDGTAVLIRQTRLGDANLDGQVNLADFNCLAANFGASAGLWSRGDFNYDGLINLIDFNRLAAHFGLSA